MPRLPKKRRTHFGAHFPPVEDLDVTSRAKERVTTDEDGARRATPPASSPRAGARWRHGPPEVAPIHGDEILGAEGEFPDEIPPLPRAQPIPGHSHAPTPAGESGLPARRERRHAWPLVLFAGAVSLPWTAARVARRGVKRARAGLGRVAEEWRRRGETIWRAWWGEGPRARRA